MVKLVRMVSNNTTGFFESQFNTNVNIKPDSKIGLLSFSGTLTPVEQFLDRNIIIFTDNNNPDTSVLVRNGLYNGSNYNQLLEDTEDEFNNEFAFDSGLGNLENLGGQFSCRIENAKPTIEFRIAYNTNNFDQQNLVKNIQFDGLQKSLTATTLAQSTNSLIASNALGRYNVASATGYVNYQIRKLAIDPSAPVGQIQSNGFLIGLSKTDLSSIRPEDFTENMIDYSIGVGSSDGVGFSIYRREGGTITDLNTQPEYIAENNANNSEIMIMKNASAVELSYTDNSGDRVVLYSYNIAFGQNTLYPFIVLHTGGTYLSLKYYGSTLDPYNLPLTSGDESDSFFSNPIMEGDEEPPLYLFDLSNASSFANFFGFTEPSNGIYQQTSAQRLANTGSKRASFKIQANKDFRPALGSTSYILEILNINLESFDSSQKQRKNILSTVIMADAMDGLTKDDGGVIFLDISNKDAVDLRNIKLRLVDQNYNPVSTTGTSVAVLLLANPNESSF